MIALLLRRPLSVAAWQAAVCLAAAGPLLSLVVQTLALPKHLDRMPRAFLAALWALGGLAELVLPWLGWSLLLWLLNAPERGWEVALRAGGGVAAFSYLTGFGLLAHFRPRPHDVEITEYELPLACLPEAFDGYRILHISDLHAGPQVPLPAVAARLARAEGVRADLVAFTGDLAEMGDDLPERAAEALARLRAPDGLVAVLGNHDFWLGQERVRRALQRQGAAVLRNEHITLRRAGQRLHIVGVNDSAYTPRDDLAAALAGIPEGECVVLLSHAPGIARRPLAARAAAILAGHTHGGQVRLPLIGPLHVPGGLGRRYAAGLHRMGEQWLFINRGLGEIFPPMRVACPPEIALLTLRRAP